MLDVVKLKSLQKDFERRAREEFIENLDEAILHFVVSKFFRQNFTESKSRKSKLKQSARVLHNWEKEGVIPPLNPAEGKSRQFNKVESIWLELAISCREFGLSLTKIKLLRKALFDKLARKVTILEYALMHSIIQEAIILIMEEDGEIHIMPQSLYAELVSNNQMPHHLHFNLLSLADLEFTNNNFKTIKKEAKSGSLTEKELQLLYFLRTGDYESIKVKIKDGEIFLLEGSKRIPTNSRVIEIIKNNKYQDIEIKTHNGEISHFQVTDKVKL